MDICFNMPISIVMQKGCISSVAEKVALLGKRAFLVCGSEVSSIDGINAVTGTFAYHNIPYSIFCCDEKDTLIRSANKIAEQVKSTKDTVLVAVGSNDILECGKVASLFATQDAIVSYEDLVKGQFCHKTIPTILIPTEIGACIQAISPTVYITYNDDKSFILDIPKTYANVVLMDSNSYKNMSHGEIVDVAFDILYQAIESIISAGSKTWIQTMASSSLSNMAFLFMDLLEDYSLDISNLLYNGVITGIAFNQTNMSGLTELCNSLMPHCNISHGQAVGVLVIPYLNFVSEKNPEAVGKIISALALNSIQDLKKVLDVLIRKHPTLTDKEILNLAEKAYSLSELTNSSIAITTREEYIRILQQI